MNSEKRSSVEEIAEEIVGIKHLPNSIWLQIPSHYVQVLKDNIKEALQQERTRVEELEAALAQQKTKTHCAYCGEDFLLDTVTAEQVGEHIQNCPKHPIADYKAQISELEGQLSVAVEALQKLADRPLGFTTYSQTGAVAAEALAKLKEIEK